MEDKLQMHRALASALSLGASHDVIYKKALNLVSHRRGLHMDFGAGQGHFITFLKEKYPELKITGVDLMEKPGIFNGEIQWQVSDLNDTLPVENASYDSISALEIIEHLENPRHVFRELARVLRPGGLLVLSTPNNESYRSIISYLLRGHFVDFTDKSYPAHITALNRKDLVRAAQEAGLKLDSWAYSNHGCLPGMTRYTWQQMSFRLLRGRRFSDNLFAIFRKIEK